MNTTLHWWNPLHFAFENDKIEIVERLIKHGAAQIDKQDISEASEQ